MCNNNPNKSVCTWQAAERKCKWEGAELSGSGVSLQPEFAWKVVCTQMFSTSPQAGKQREEDRTRGALLRPARFAVAGPPTAPGKVASFLHPIACAFMERCLLTSRGTSIMGQTQC